MALLRHRISIADIYLSAASKDPELLKGFVNSFKGHCPQVEVDFSFAISGFILSAFTGFVISFKFKSQHMQRVKTNKP